jgi:hypothetical protein
MKLEGGNMDFFPRETEAELAWASLACICKILGCFLNLMIAWKLGCYILYRCWPTTYNYLARLARR